MFWGTMRLPGCEDQRACLFSFLIDGSGRGGKRNAKSPNDISRGECLADIETDHMFPDGAYLRKPGAKRKMRWSRRLGRWVLSKASRSNV